MAAEQDGAQPAPSDDTTKQFEAETAAFASPKVVQAKWAEDRNVMIGNAQPEGGEDDGDGSVETASGDVGNDTEGEPAAAAVDQPAEGAEDEGETAPKPDAIPAWLADRVTRATEKERKLAEAENRIAEREQELRDREAAAEAREKAAALKRPNPDDFDDPDAYEDAKAAYDTARREAADAAAKVNKKKEDPAPAADALPLGLTPADMSAAYERIVGAVPKTLAEKLGGAGVVLPHAVFVEISEQPSKAEIERMSKFVLQNQETIKAIAKLPPRQQAAALVRAYKPPSEGKKVSDAPEPITPVAGHSGNSRGLAQMAYADFERAANQAEIEARKSGKPFSY